MKGSSLYADILLAVVDQLVAAHNAESRAALHAFSLTSHEFSRIARPGLFADVQWPQGNKHDDDESELLFFPRSLWPFIRHFRLHWPEEWSEIPRWGIRTLEDEYRPFHLQKLIEALPNMPLLSSFSVICPFYLPPLLMTTLLTLPTLRDFSIRDTPIIVYPTPSTPITAPIERFALVSVAEALRVGDGPLLNQRFGQVSYYTRKYRRKHSADFISSFAAPELLSSVRHSQSLRYLHLSGSACTLNSLVTPDWPHLETLIFTGSIPKRFSTGQHVIELIDVLASMPSLTDLRLLFTKDRTTTLFSILPSLPNASTESFNQLTHLAISTAIEITPETLRPMRSLTHLCLCALIPHPRVPTGFVATEILTLLTSLPSPSKLVHLRLIIEQPLTPGLTKTIASYCPHLHTLEIELCSNRASTDPPSAHLAWPENAASLHQLRDTLVNLRLCIPFVDTDESETILFNARRTPPAQPFSSHHAHNSMHQPHSHISHADAMTGPPPQSSTPTGHLLPHPTIPLSWYLSRRTCALYFAQRFPLLQHVGFEYRKQTTTHRYEDAWLDFAVVRRPNQLAGANFSSPMKVATAATTTSANEIFWDLDKDFNLKDLPASYYAFPEVWTYTFVSE